MYIYTVTFVHIYLLKALGNYYTFRPSFLHTKRFACSSQILFMLVSLNKDLHEYTQQKLMILLAFFMLVSLI